ncbi:MAG: rhomboid family intramembrane serine protease [Chloroflexi bacterium]|nr:rhomboid family intramembrane serine protease [Chloroflexota bacterium]
MRDERGFNINAVWFLIGINLILYIATSSNEDLFWRLGLQPGFFSEEPWTIVTSMFVHDPFPSIFHILGNMVTLYFFGTYLCALVGDGRFLITYFLGGLLGNALCILYALYAPWTNAIIDPYVTYIGASGAVFSVGGALAVLRPNTKVIVFPIPAPLPLWIAVLGGFLIISLFPSVAWQAHLGGLVLGLVAGFVFRGGRRPFVRL